MLTQSCKTATVAETASGPDPSASRVARLWAYMLCGLAAIVDLFPTLRTRLLNQPCNMPSGPNTDRNVPDGDTLAESRTSGQAGEGSTAATNGDAGGKMDSSKPSKSKDNGATKTSEVLNGQGQDEDKSDDGQAGQSSKNKPQGGKGRGKGKTANANSNADSATPDGMMKVLAGGRCVELGLLLLAGLGVQFSNSPRAKYGLPDMYRMLVAMCCGSKKSSTAEGQYKKSTEPGKVRLPSRSWLYKKLNEIREDYMLKRCQRMLRSSVLQAKRHGMLRRPIVAAIDEHDIPFHAKVMRTAWQIRNRKKKGTVKFNRIITISCVVYGQRIVLAAEVVSSKKEQAAAVKRLLKQCRDCGIRISSVLTDRGYCATDVTATIREAGIPMLMPAVKHKNIKEIIRKFDAGELDAVSTHTIASGKRTESFRLVILRRQRGDRDMSAEAGALHKAYEGQVRVEGEYYVFATTMVDPWIDEDPKRIAEHYKLRWGIENSYKSYEELRPWTTSNKMSVRFLLWFIPFVLCNLWVIARFITGRQTGVVGGRSPMPLDRFVSYMLAVLNENTKSGRPPD